MIRRTPVMERLMARVEVSEGGCWIWTGSRDPMGYGRIGLGGRGDGTGLTHRVAYTHLRGPIPEGLDLDHLCRVPACCNPDHLEPVTRLVNVSRGLRAKGYGPRERTHCKQGHPLTHPNLYEYEGQAGRRCRTCAIDSNRASRARRKEAS